MNTDYKRLTVLVIYLPFLNKEEKQHAQGQAVVWW